MNKEELIGKLQMVYVGDINALNELIDYYDGLKEGIEELQQENKQLKEQLLVTQTNEETFRLEMKDITQTLGLDEDTIFDDVKAYVTSLEVENQKYKEVIDRAIEYINDNLIISSILGGKKYYTINDYSFDYRELLDILKEVE